MPAAVVHAALTNIIDFVSQKYERQRQQTRRPCDHHSQQEPLIGLHGTISLDPFYRNVVMKSLARGALGLCDKSHTWLLCAGVSRPSEP